MYVAEPLFDIWLIGTCLAGLTIVIWAVLKMWNFVSDTRRDIEILKKDMRIVFDQLDKAKAKGAEQCRD